MSKYLRVDEIVESISKTHKFDIDIMKFLNTSDVYSVRIININYLPLSQLKGQAKKTIKKHDILFSEIRPQNKKFAYVDFDETYDFVVSTKLMVLRKINPLVDNKYFYYFLTNDHMLSVLQTRAENRICSFPQITFDLLSDYKVRVPDINEQERISSLDKKIEINNQINAELESMAKTLYDYWFVQFDFPDQNGKPYKSSGGKMFYNLVLKREIPEGWKCDYLGSLTTLIRRGISHKYVEQNGISVLNQNLFEINVFYLKKLYDMPLIYQVMTKDYYNIMILLLIRKEWGTLGRVTFIKRLIEQRTTVDSHVTIVRANTNKILSEYLSWTMLHYQPIIELASNGSTGQVELNKLFLEELNVVIPNLFLQQKFREFVNPVVNQIAIKEKESEELEKLRDFLLPMLMNGQVTIKE